LEGVSTALALNIAFMAAVAGRGRPSIIGEGAAEAAAKRSPLRETLGKIGERLGEFKGRVGERLSRIGERIDEALDRYAARTKENVRQAIRNGRRNELGVLGEIPDTIEVVREGVNKVLSEHLESIKEVTPDAEVAYRGSLARGTKGAHKGNAPFDVQNFDVDAFIVSDSLAESVRPSRGFRSGRRVGELRGIQDAIHESLKEQFSGLRDQKPSDKFTFRIFSREEFERVSTPDHPYKIVNDK
jgi:hypothetical protein